MTPLNETWNPPPLCNVHFTAMALQPPFIGGPSIRTCACGRSFLPGKDRGYGYLRTDRKAFKPEPNQKHCKECKQPMYVYGRDEAEVPLYRCPGESTHQSK
jgi:hypothetical protein